jgi:3-oxoacyl-[acyl-carrier protein] reductase
VNLGLHGRRALVGGATSGLGAAIASALADEGCRLVLWSRTQERLDDAAAGLRARGVTVETVAADAATPEAADFVASQAQQKLGGIDIVVLNAGGPPTSNPAATAAVEWQSALQSLLLTPVELASTLLPAMRERGWGRIVAVLSSGVREPIPGLVYSNAGRVALAAWLKTVSREIAPDGVTANGVIPGRIRTARTAALDAARADREGRKVEEVRAESTSQIPAGRYGEPEEFAAAVAFLCSAQAAYQTGTFVTVDGGMLRSL